MEIIIMIVGILVYLAIGIRTARWMFVIGFSGSKGAIMFGAIIGWWVVVPFHTIVCMIEITWEYVFSEAKG